MAIKKIVNSPREKGIIIVLWKLCLSHENKTASVITKMADAFAWVLHLPDKKIETFQIGDLENTWLHNVGFFLW